MTRIDSRICAGLLCRITGEIAADRPRSASGDSIGDQIGRVRSISAISTATLRRELETLHPGIGFRNEEDPRGHTNGERDYWHYDPIDGAYHYLQGLPLWSSSLALVRGGRVVLGIVYDPVLGELFIAAEGEPATLNGAAISGSPKSELRAAVLGTAIPPLAQVGKEEHAEALRLLGAISPEVFVVRPMAATSLQLAYVAAGRLDAYWENGRDIGDWLAGSMLVTGAGGVVTDLAGAPLGEACDGILAGNATLHRALRSAVGLVADTRSSITPGRR